MESTVDVAIQVKEIVGGDMVIDNIIDLTVKRLNDWKITSIEAFELSFAVQSIIEHIKLKTNQSTVPEGLTFVAVDLICGEFLQKRMDTGNLPEFEVSQALKSLKVGDTTTTFQKGGGNGIDMLINALTSRKGELLSYRKLKW